MFEIHCRSLGSEIYKESVLGNLTQYNGKDCDISINSLIDATKKLSQ